MSRDHSMFPGFTHRHFDAYQPGKWRSNAFNLERRLVKEALAQLARDLSAGLLASDGTLLASELSREYPALCNQKQVRAQQLYFARPGKVRKELDRIIDRARGMASLIEDPSLQSSHLHLAVTVEHERIQVALVLPAEAAIDRRNLEARLSEPRMANEFIALFAGLPESMSIAIVTSDRPAAPLVSVRAIDRAEIQALVTRLGEAAGTGRASRLVIGHSIARAEVVAMASAVTVAIRAVLVALLPVYQFIAWSRDNDHIALGRDLRRERIVRSQRGLAKNDPVRIITGLFSGRSGVIQDIDARGILRVLVGGIPIKLRAEQVEKQ